MKREPFTLQAWTNQMKNPYGWPVDPIEPLTYITDRLNNHKPFIYLRFNDGEAYSMLGMKTTPESNGEHVYSESIATSLAHAFGQKSFIFD